MKEKTNSEILYDTFVKYCYNILYIRYIMGPILISTIIACYLEVQASNTSKNIAEDFTNNVSAGLNIFLYCLFLLSSIILKQVNEMVFSGPIQYLYKIVGVEAFFHYISLDLESFNKLGSGEIQTIIERKSRAYGDILELTTLSAIPTVIIVVMSFFSVYSNLGEQALYVMLATSGIYVYFTFIFSIWRNNVRRQCNKAQDKLSNKLQDFLANHETIKAYNTEDGTISYFDETQKPFEYYGIKSHRILYALFYLQKMTFAIQAIVIITLGSFGYFPIKLSSQQLVYYISISKTLTNSLNEMGMLYTRYVQGFLNAKSGYYDFKEDNQVDKIREIKFNDKLEFNNVSFTYENRPILVDASFQIKKGERVAIIGKNGTGKSTLMKLLMKFYKCEGKILVDDVDIDDVSDRGLRKLFSYATQNTFLFDNTVNYNISYGTNKISDRDILELAKKIGVYDSILELGDGFQTSVGERGRLLSGGERQKVMLMRALLKESEIVLLDEPTSALDKETELEVMNFIFNEFRNHTFLMIAHNLELLSLFDKILYVNNQKIKTITDVKTKIKEDPSYFMDILCNE
ncbi:ABC transporter [Vairimorpha necatrix]|uniref:ABC transporter n=1 Tax=Vairimorpha necatrix TaxID=6039 RepID=A0AAX4J8S8_9MICR